MAPSTTPVDAELSAVVLPCTLVFCVTLTSGAAAVSNVHLPTAGSTPNAPMTILCAGTEGISNVDPISHTLTRDPVVLARLDGAAGTAPAIERGAYAVREGADALLAAEPGLAYLLLEECGELRKVFGRDAEIVVEPTEDPEGADVAPMLFALVRTEMEGREAAEALIRFNDAWWLDNMRRANGKLEVSVEFA